MHLVYSSLRSVPSTLTVVRGFSLVCTGYSGGISMVEVEKRLHNAIKTLKVPSVWLIYRCSRCVGPALLESAAGILSMLGAPRGCRS